jgi:hypothetical protein
MDQIYLLIDNPQPRLSCQMIERDETIVSFVLTNTTRVTAWATAWVTVLRHALQHAYKKITIVDQRQTPFDYERPLFNYSTIAQFQQRDVMWGLVGETLLFSLCSDLSLMSTDMDHILSKYPLTIANNQITPVNRDHVGRYKIHETITLEETKSCALTPIKYVIQKYPYCALMNDSSQNLCVDFATYDHLCQHLEFLDFYDRIRVITRTGNGDTKGDMKGDTKGDTKGERNVICFDPDFYLQTYPCYKKIFKRQEDAQQHFINHGIHEQLLPNKTIFQLKRAYQEALLENLLYDLVEQIELHETPIIYVLTRTCDRPQLFQECVQSIESQNYPNIRHIVSYDNQSTYSYVSKYKAFHHLNLIPQKGVLHPNHYIDCFYDYICHQEAGWVLVLDDDDKILSPYALHYLAQSLTRPDKLIFWMLYRPDKMIYPKNIEKPQVGEIGSCCYLYHTSMIQKGHWCSTGIGDYKFFKYIFDKTPQHEYKHLPLTGVNYHDQVSGWTAM